jgi:hypothetical protein
MILNLESLGLKRRKLLTNEQVTSSEQSVQVCFIFQCINFLISPGQKGKIKLTLAEQV